MTKLYNAALIVLLWFVFAEANAQQSPLTVEKIMQDPQWMGTFPSRVQWGAQGEKIYFQYNLDGSPSDSLYKVNMDDLQKIEKVNDDFFKLRSSSFKDKFFDRDTILVKKSCNSCFFG